MDRELGRFVVSIELCMTEVGLESGIPRGSNLILFTIFGMRTEFFGLFGKLDLSDKL